MKQQLADIVTNEKYRLNGFKVLGVFPFHLRYIRTDTHIQLCKIRDKMEKITDEEPSLSHFYDVEVQEQMLPLMIDYCLTGLLNNRRGGIFLKWFLRKKIERCSHSHLFNIFIHIQKLNEPAFFLTYWKLLKQPTNTLLREEKQS